MKEKYKAAFIVPVGANKILGEDGWEFETSKRIPSEIKDYFIEPLNLRFLESYLGIESYEDGNIKMTVIFDSQGEIENIHFQLYQDVLSVLSKICQGGKVSAEVELFVP